eukprot:snap_masked-scaffold_31-processed-gene-3.6-mRNA-1 protein AED:1.00 eAED:1.00 QI:0/0/0/0/1/1/2/0/76
MNRFMWKRASCYRFYEEQIKKNGSDKRMLRGCTAQCPSSPTCTFEVNIKFDLAFVHLQNKNLEHVEHDLNLDPDKR